jgi:Fur family ferric uptake transcriptional regulator
MTSLRALACRKNLVTELSSILKEAGLKVTVPRLKILQLLQQNQDQHFSAEGLYRMLQQQGNDIGIATIYRVLTQCAEAGLVKRLQFEGGRSHFEIAQDDHHDHIVCIRCGRVEEFHDDVIERRQQQVAHDAGFDLEDHSMVLYGLCVDCRSRSEKD